MSNLAASAVALVVLIDLATGQGPPVYTNYLQQQDSYRAPLPPPPQLSPVAYVHRSDYDSKKVDKEYEKAIELGKVSNGKERKKLEKEYEKQYGEGYDDDDKSKQANQGMFASLSNRMSGAWKTISSFGREKRAVNGQETNDSNPIRSNYNSASQSIVKPTSAAHGSTPSQESDNSEYLQHKNSGYIYFKVPKHLVCGQ